MPGKTVSSKFFKEEAIDDLPYNNSPEDLLSKDTNGDLVRTSYSALKSQMISGSKGEATPTSSPSPILYKLSVSTALSVSPGIGSTYTQGASTYKVDELNLTNGLGDISVTIVAGSAPSSSGTLNKASGTGDAVINYSSVTVDQFEKWDVKTPGTYTNFKDASNNPIVVTADDLDGKLVQIWVTNGVSKLEPVDLPVSPNTIKNFEDLTFPAVEGTPAIYQGTQWRVKVGQTATNSDLPSLDPASKWEPMETNKANFIYNDIYPVQDLTNYSTQTQNGNASTTLTAINDRQSSIKGILSKIKGLFPATGNLNLFVAKNRKLVSASVYSFDVGQTFTVNIPAVGLNEIDVKSLNIKIDIGDGLGVNTTSPSKPFYGNANTAGFGWFRDSTGSTITTGDKKNFTLVSTNSFSIGFQVEGEKYAPTSEVYLKTQNDTLLAAKVDKTFLLANTKPYNVDSLNATSNGTAFLLNNVPSPVDGYLKKIRIKSADAGTATFQILDRKTNNASAAGQTDTFTCRAIFTIANVLVGDFTYDIPGNVFIKKGQYTAVAGGTGNIRTPFNSSGSVTGHLGWFQAQLGGGAKPEGQDIVMTYQPFTAIFDYTIENEIYQRVQADPPKYKLNTITATRNSEDYNSIRNIIKGITDASDLNEYKIIIPNGEWLEADIQGKKNVYLEGQSKDAIIKFDADLMASYTAPSDYSYPSESGKLFSAIALNLRHTFFALDDINLKNLTVFCKGGKYPLHLDNIGFKNINVYNVRVIADNCSYIVGIGVRGGQSIKFTNCILERVEANTFCGVFAHNTTAQTSGSSITFDRCKFVNSDYVLVDEVGSNQTDDWRFTNCFTSTTGKGRFEFMVDKGADGNTLWTNPATGQKEPDPRNVPYNILLNTTGTKISNLTFRPANTFNPSYDGGQRDQTKILSLNIIDYNP